jgi:hypothetical protein
MKIKEKLEILENYYSATRQVGHTTLLKEGLKNYSRDKFVLSYKKEYGIELGCNPKDVISWYSLNATSLAGFNRPLAIDNAVMHMMLRDILEEMNELEKFKQKYLQIKKIIEDEN